MVKRDKEILYKLRFYGFFFVFLTIGSFYAQEDINLLSIKKVAISDTIKLENVSINTSGFTIKDKTGKEIDSSYYKIDYSKGLFTLRKQIVTDSLIIEYLKYPDFLTRSYKALDTSLIVKNTNNLNKLFQLSQPNTSSSFQPFDGLTTTGSISRGVSIGNNQNSVLNSELDLQISGKLSDKVSLRASIQDANIPLQESGYSQRLDEFDQVFIELNSANWNVRAGDIDLQNDNSHFAHFSKRLQGLSINAHLNHPNSQTHLFASGAIVRGQFTRSEIRPQEGNQGPYKLKGPNGEPYVLIISGSETVYVNGMALERGENNDYIINYNAGEIIFNATYPITSEMRITIDYQFSDRNYARLIAYGGANYSTDKLNLAVAVYNENDAKNQPLQQNLSETQIELLKNAGDNQDLMVSPSEVPVVYNENRVLYKKEINNGNEIFVYSNDPHEELFSLKFTNVGANLGSYSIDDEFNNGLSTVYKYVGLNQGEYEPIVRLIAPTKLQMVIINGSFKPVEKTAIDFELVGSQEDLNLFSDLDSEDNNGFAGQLKLKQNIVKSNTTWNLSAYLTGDYIHKNFRTIEQLYNVEFNRDWNIENSLGNQQLLESGIVLNHPEKGKLNYRFEHLNYSENFNGNRHEFTTDLNFNAFRLLTNTSVLNASDTANHATFTRSYNQLTQHFKKVWIGLKVDFESNHQENKLTKQLTPKSQRYMSYEIFSGIGDSTKVYLETGFKNRINDSLKTNRLLRVNRSNTLYLKSKIIQNTNTNLSLYANYRNLNHEDQSKRSEQSINSRIQYAQKLFNQLLFLNTVYETNSGSLPQQEFTYVEVDPGQGTYTWIDYNNNNIQELEEFEVAQFRDQGIYIRVLLPNRVYLKTHQNRFSQTLTLNPSVRNLKDLWSHFYNQTTYLIDRKVAREGNNFDFNPFSINEDNLLGLQLQFKNVLFFNRGKQRFSISYTHINNRSKSVLSTGAFERSVKNHQLNAVHKFYKSWIFGTVLKTENITGKSENFVSKNYNIDQHSINPNLSYLLSDNMRFNVFFQYSNKENTIGGFETLKQETYGASFTFSRNKKAAITAELSYFKNSFSGSANSPVGYQMMEGLQPGKNYSWNLIVQKQLTKFLDLNLNYIGRNNETSSVIHTGNIQLKAYF